MTIPSSKEWRHLFHQAREIAAQLEQELNSAHVLLSLFLLPNKAEQLLLDRGINEDVILAEVMGLNDEPANTLELITQKSQQIAISTGSQQIDSLHLLIAMSRVTVSMAYQLLERCNVGLPMLRNQAMSYLTGRVRRRFDSSSEVALRSSSPPEYSSAPEQQSQLRETQIDEGPRRDYYPTQINSRSPHHETRPEPILPSDGLSEEQYPWLNRLGRNLTKAALEGKFDPLIGREKELNEMIDILGKRRANNPCLVGPPGVGKTALVEGLAVLLAHSDIPGLSGKTIIELDMGSLLAGTQLRGSLSEKLKGIKEEVKAAAGQIIVFIDEVHTLVRAGSTGESAQDASNDLKAALSRGEFPCIGATTIQDYKTYVETDPALVRRFHLIWVEEPSIEEACRIVEGVVPHYASHHMVQYLPESVRASVRLSARFLHDRRLPAKAIDLLDLAGSRARRSGSTTVGRAQVAKVIAQLASVPEEHLLVEDRQRLLDMEELVGNRVIGHRDALAHIARVIRCNYAGFNGPRPIGSFLFLGPPGVGKTETAKAIASFLFHHEHAMLRIDMSEYQDASSVTRLIGAPPGFVGHDEGGQLTESIRTRPYQLVLLDEIEKAHRDVLMLLLQLLDEGVLTDGKGRRVSFSQCVVVMTSNLGSEVCETSSRGPIGFGRSNRSSDELKDQILEEARKQLPLELWNRIDERLVFAPLELDEIRDIARLMIKQSSKRLREERDIAYVVTEDVIDWVIEYGGYHPRWGARPMRSMIQRQLEASLAELILKGEVRPGARLEGELDESGALSWSILSAHPSQPEPPEIGSNPPRRAPSVPATPASGLPRFTSQHEPDDEDAELDLLALPL